jgi:hypothetical protein
LDAYDFMPLPVGPAFDFRQMQLARIRQARCLTFTRNLVGLDTVGGIVAPREAPSGPALIRPVALQVGVVTNDNDAERAMAFFNHLGYRTRSVGSPGLGTRVYVEARTLGNIETIIGLAQQVGSSDLTPPATPLSEGSRPACRLPPQGAYRTKWRRR